MAKVKVKKRTKKYSPVIMDLNKTLAKLVCHMERLSEERCLAPESFQERSGKRFFMDLLEHTTIGLSQEEVDHIVGLCDKKDVTTDSDIVAYISHNHHHHICCTINDYAQVLLSEVLPKLSFVEQVFVKQSAKLEEMAYDWVCNEFSCDLDVRDVVHSIKESQNIFRIITISEQEKDGNTWKEKHSETFAATELAYSSLLENGGEGSDIIKFVSKDGTKIVRTKGDSRKVFRISSDIEGYLDNESLWYGEPRNEIS